jgi:AcrR family transcriptional regulator/predicted DNA-binding transcriptional regulator AlpA
MKIDELVRKTGFNRRLIYKLIHMGLLPRPARVGSNQFAFDDRHVEALGKIAQLRREEPIPQSELKDATQPDAHKSNDEEPPSIDRKRQIMDRAIALFSKKGFEKTKLSDITDSLGLGKGTFYLYFKSKKDLLIECISQLSSAVVERESWERLRNEPDFIRRQRITLFQFLKAFPTFNGIHILLAASLKSDDPKIVEKAKGYFKILSSWLRKDLRRAIDDKAVREVNTSIMSALMLGMAQGLGTLLTINPEYSIEQGMDAFMDVLEKGIVLTKAEESEAAHWDVTDSADLHVELHNLLFDENPYLPTKLGQGEVQVPTQRILSLEMQKSDDGYTAEVTMDNGEKRAFAVDGQSVLSGEFGYGVYRVRLEELSRIAGIPRGKRIPTELARKNENPSGV